MPRTALLSAGLLAIAGASSALGQVPAAAPTATAPGFVQLPVAQSGLPQASPTAPQSFTAGSIPVAAVPVAVPALAPAAVATGPTSVPVLAGPVAPAVQIAQGLVVQPIPVPPNGNGGLVSMYPQPVTVPVGNGPAPVFPGQPYGFGQAVPPASAQFPPQGATQPAPGSTVTYTPTYYWYLYQPPVQLPQSQPVMFDPMPQPAMPYGPSPYGPSMMPMMSGMSAMNGGMLPMMDQQGMVGMYQAGQLMNARGETGHIRYPYYSYRRPWYFPGQPSFNTTINGPVW